MNLKMFQVDAFTNQLFGGNPAAVIPLKNWLPDETLLKIAIENNLSETAFFIEHENHFDLRWFTPAYEVDLCGHATLATAHVLWTELGYTKDKIVFKSKSGQLGVRKVDGFYEMDFPTDQITKADLPSEIAEALACDIIETWKGRDDFLVLLKSKAALTALAPDFRTLGKLKTRGVIATAQGQDVDFVSRCFYPYYGIDEDPVTGSAHTTLAPFWSEKLGKNKMTARQISRRGGFLKLHLQAERTAIQGQAVTFLSGVIEI
ncbi:MAG: PhzF family phenazine biosynthesis protein [Bacteroidota bacterium]